MSLLLSLFLIALSNRSMFSAQQIMTDSLSKTRYENISQGLKVVESHLLESNNLTECLNNEISQGVITCAEEAVDWIKHSLLFHRIQSNPLYYGLSGRGNDNIHSFLLAKCADSITKLSKIRAILEQDDGTFSPDAASRIMSRNFIDFETMKSIVKLPHDCGPLQLLHMLSRCEKIQTPVRRAEKKELNEAYKLVKYKFEGPQSKIRIQTPEQKAFVLLQSSIGKYHFRDASLRREMSNILDGAFRILAAVEEYARVGSRNGQVAVQGWLMRRALYSSLWGEKDGVLNQINGISHEMTKKLTNNGIKTFADAMNSSSEEIVDALNVTPSFASGVRTASAKILQRTLKLSACTKPNEAGGLDLHIKVERKMKGGDTVTGGNRIVYYSLLVYTDRPGGLLHYCEDLASDAEMIVSCPPKFGRAYIRLLGNIVGIDEKVAVDGNDSIEKSSFKLSPAAARASSSAPKTKKPAPKAKPPSPRKRLFNSHQSSVSKVSDLRLHKRGRINKNTSKDEDCIVVDSDSDTENPHSLNKGQQQKPKSQTLVTPSPHPSRRQTQQQQTNTTPAPLYNSSRSSSQQRNAGASGRTKSSHFAANTSSKSRAVRNTTSSWFQQKKQQKTSQSSAFNSPKENPFSGYSFDPNSIEKNLNSQAVQSKEPSIFPSTVASSNFTATKPRSSRTFRTPATRRKNATSSSRISSHDLLQRKANELNQHRHQMTTTRYHGDHDGASQMSAADPFHQQAFPAGNRYHEYDGNYEHDQFSQPHQQQFGHGQQQYLQNMQPQLNSFQSTFHEESFDQMRGPGPFGHQYDFPQQIPRPGTGMTARSRFSMPYQQQQQFVQPQPQQLRGSRHFIQPQQRSFQPSYHEDTFDQGYSVGGHDFPQQMYHRPGTSHESVQFSQPHQHEFSQQQQQQQEVKQVVEEKKEEAVIINSAPITTTTPQSTTTTSPPAQPSPAQATTPPIKVGPGGSPAKSKEEDLELTTQVILEYVKTMDSKSSGVVDDESDDE
uniref:DNA 3'-5' helicase n=1 Tax=Skeletonema marinoi TaxID=267567 RepID=A0A7S2P7S2_9STRA|mmetsp:Transcript_14626/g.24610  ORF Transcript_14626/g.24610 Transcript_14626/m.24610 type:complete len:1002 (+) Transcript_14626:42-3047(+)